MIYDQIRQTPTCYKDAVHGKSHESLLRAFQILQKVKWLLSQGASPEVTLELIAMMEDDLPANTEGQ